MPLDSENSVDAASTKPYNRDHLTLIALLVIAAIGIVLTIVVAGPFIPGLAWGLAFAVVAWPMHRRIAACIHKPDIAAGAAVFLVALVLILPVALVAWQLAEQSTDLSRGFREQVESGEWKKKVQQHPTAAKVWGWVESRVDVDQESKNISESMQQRAGRWLKGATWGTVQMLIALFALFYFFRDRGDVLKTVRGLMPMSEKETDYFFERVRAMTHASIYGTLVVAAIQGLLGGLMFWILQVPGAALWGFAMGVFSIVPTLGTFVIWAPAALFLAVQGSVAKAVLLAAWGLLVVSSIDNLLYPILVGKEIRIHTLPVFIAIVGGLFIFGAAGLVLGPVILAATVALLDILRSRTDHGRSAEKPS
jgi:predicted PurR-regulated permease PerM